MGIFLSVDAILSAMACCFSSEPSRVSDGEEILTNEDKDNDEEDKDNDEEDKDDPVFTKKNMLHENHLKISDEYNDEDEYCIV